MPSEARMSEVRTLLLTGASRGIGHATVKRFSARGVARADLLARALRRALPLARRRGEPHRREPRRPRGYHRRHRDHPREGWGAGSTRSSTTPGSRPRDREGERLSTLTTDLRTWGQVLPRQLLRLRGSRARAARGARRRKGGRGQTSPRSRAGVCIRSRGAAYATSKAALRALTREMGARLRAAGRAGKRDRAGGRWRPRSCRRAPSGWPRRCRCAASASPTRWPRVIHFLCCEDSSYVSGNRDRGQRRPARLTPVPGRPPPVPAAPRPPSRGLLARASQCDPSSGTPRGEAPARRPGRRREMGRPSGRYSSDATATRSASTPSPVCAEVTTISG